ncbi:SDR family NAD(P)-dependent oxidoreductase [Mucilaginibacter sp. UYCu711]|uniref:SDR family NAD(P)-dependent oxidoreductase n=1 Tax=Mucilaginibacter sp. UYCu711 TaxID=3156339 RepID=UPI003D1A624B
MSKAYIITGANKGLGAALANLALSQEDTLVISISRKANKEQRSPKFYHLHTDFEEQQLIEQLGALKKILSITDHIVFISNVGTILPIAKIGKFEENDVLTQIKVNVTSPVLIANFIVKEFALNILDFVNISSGAANQAIANWSLYCSSKAFVKMFFNTLKLENGNIRVFNIDPGVLDTQMQATIRNSDFPENKNFAKLKDDNLLKSPQDAARDIFNNIK